MKTHELIEKVLLGSAKSGNWGHQGAPGIGGSSAKGAGGGASAITWSKRGKGLTASMYQKTENLGVKYSIIQRPHFWEVSVKVHDGSAGREYTEFRRKASFVYAGGKALGKAKAAAETHWAQMESGVYGESPDL